MIEIKINKKIVWIFSGLGLVLIFIVVAIVIYNIKSSGKGSQTVLENSENMVKPNNFDSGEIVHARIKIDNINDNKNNTTEKDLVNYVMVISKVLYDHGLLSEKMFNDFLENFREDNNLKLYCKNALLIRGEENYKKIKDIFAKTDFKKIEINEEYFKQFIGKIKEVMLKEKNRLESFCLKIKEAYDKNDEKVLIECYDIYMRNIILKQENVTEEYNLNAEELESVKKGTQKLKETVEKQKKEGKLSETNKDSLLTIKDGYEKTYIPKLKENIEKINKIKFKDVKNLHKKLKINGKVEKIEVKKKTN